jgi:hypothetical protein
MKNVIRLLSFVALIGLLAAGCASSKKGGCGCPGTRGMSGF